MINTIIHKNKMPLMPLECPWNAPNKFYYNILNILYIIYTQGQKGIIYIGIRLYTRARARMRTGKKFFFMKKNAPNKYFKQKQEVIRKSLGALGANESPFIFIYFINYIYFRKITTKSCQF